MNAPIHARRSIIAAFLTAAGLLLSGVPTAAGPNNILDKCPWFGSPPNPAPSENTTLILKADSAPEGICVVPANLPDTPYVFANIHILEGATLRFSRNAKIDLWAQNILVEKGGTLEIGTESEPVTGLVTIHLYGRDQTGTDKNQQGQGVLCRTGYERGRNDGDFERCGVPKAIWESNVATKDCSQPNKHCEPGNPNNAVKISTVIATEQLLYDGPVTDDYFYPYHGLPFDMAMDPTNRNATGYFGYKVLGVSYGGTLKLFGKKGACTANCDDPANTGQSWVRLAKTIGPDDTGNDVKTLIVSSPVDWKAGDEIVVTTTDYLPGHSEQLTVAADTSNGTTVKVKQQVQYHHNGSVYPLPSDVKAKTGITATSVETRAAVALLTRSIRIVSEGPQSFCNPVTVNNQQVIPDTCFPADSYFGGHVVIAQGFKLVQIQGVEFKQLGQGGRSGHYPVHFHHARKTQNTFVKDSSINESMTRWIVLHGTQDVTLQRNVGWMSIGHGFYLEDGTEINNKLYANLGVFARAAIVNKQNPRRVPGILAAPDQHLAIANALPYKSDVDHPTVFWIMNGWNDFQYNMAAGAATCGACYWLVPGYNSTMSRTVGDKGPKWESYASMQSNAARAASTPLMNFEGNYCTAAMTSFQTIGDTEPCNGLSGPDFGPGTFITAVKNDLAENTGNLSYYPGVDGGGGRFATRCGGETHDPHQDCSVTPGRCTSGDPDGACMPTIISKYTTSFNYAPFNFAAIWLRPQWYLLTDSAITDVQMAGLTMVSGGGYTTSDAPTGHWALTRRTVFVGHTQEEKNIAEPNETPILMPDNRYAANGGPANPYSTLTCARDRNGNRVANSCVSIDEGLTIQLSNFGMYQRLFSVYDGPAFQEKNAYLNIKVRHIEDCKIWTDSVNHAGGCDKNAPQQHGYTSEWLWGTTLGLAKGYTHPDNPKPEEAFCFQPNAAIGWKQPNGFYYPPAFHSASLYFGKDVDTQGVKQGGVDVRHFVVSPVFEPGTLNTKFSAVEEQYCNFNSGIFTGFAGNDRQTVLNDDDGSLTGYTGPKNNSTVINLDDFFSAPVDATQCLSDNSSRTSPYEYMSTVLYPKCAKDGKCALAPNPRPPAGDGDLHKNNGDWNRACTSEKCYGVPLYRQDLTPRADEGIARSIRMMGQETSQRSTLTVNHGTYYLDTSAGKKTQCAPQDEAACSDSRSEASNSINVFKPGDTYYLFNIYAKDDTEQTYRIYVGPTSSTTPEDPLAFLPSIQLMQAKIENAAPVFGNFKPFPANRIRWMNGNKLSGVVEVDLKVKDVIPDYAKNLKTAKENKCFPKTYCQWNKDGNNGLGACEDKNSTASPKGQDVCKWAIADLDCPDGGCVGFAFTLPNSFETSDPPKAPPAGAPVSCFEADGKTPTPFNVAFTTHDDGVCPAGGTLLAIDFKQCTSSGETGCMQCDDFAKGTNCRCVPKP